MNEREMTSEELELLERLNNKYSGQWPQLREVEEEKSRLETAAFTISRDRDKLAKERDNLTAEIEALKAANKQLKKSLESILPHARASINQFHTDKGQRLLDEATTAIRQAVRGKSV